MNDDPLELPLFAPSERSAQEEPEASFEERPDSRSADSPMIIEELEVPPSPTSAAFSVPQRAGVGSRLAAGFIDLLVHAALVGILIGGSSLLGVEVGLRHAVPLAFVSLLFSFLYHVVPLAFWGRTPGMAVAGLRCRTLTNQPLSLPQATQHWLGLLFTAATVGLGVLLAAFGGRSLADRASGSQTLLQ